MRVHISLLCLGLSSCTCQQRPTPEALLLPHYAEWSALVDLARAGDLGKAHVVARDLTLGDLARFEADGGAAESIGGALAMAQLAEDPEELAEAVAVAAAACGQCHLSAELPPPPEPTSWDHAQLAASAVDSLVWNRESDLSAATSDVRVGPKLSWTDDMTRLARVAQLLTVCVSCHGEH